MVTHVVILLGCFAAIIAAFLFLAARDERDTRRRKQQYEEERQRFRNEIDAILARAVAQQKEDKPAMGLPVTNKERQDRRRVIKLYP
jgi:hypothetical protein